MDKEKDILTNIFRNRLKDYNQPVEKDIWAEIEKDLPENPALSGQKYPLWKFLSAAACIAVLIGLGIFFFNNNSADKKSIAITDFSTNDTLLITYKKEDYTNKKDIQELTTNIQATTNSKKVLKKVERNEIPHQEMIDEKPEIKDIEKKIIDKEEPIHQPQKKIMTEEDYASMLKSSDSELNTSAYQNTTKKDNNLTFALAVGNSGAFSSPSDNIESPPISNSYSDAASGGGYEFVKSNPVSTEFSYKTPISFGFFVRKYITEKFAIETGLTYTYLSSTETTKYSDYNFTNRDISLNYIGLPLKGVYTFYEANRLSVYLSAGGMMEKCVSGKESFGDSNYASTSLDIPEIQWSVLGNIGLNYRIAGRFGIFVEPGAAYYFDDGNDIPSIRKEHPFYFNIQAGIRLSY